MSAATMTNTKTPPGSQLFPTHHDLPESVRAQVIQQLNLTLATTSDMYSQLKQAHWNVKGKRFYQLHLLFDEIAEEIEAFVDEQAERVTALGGYALGTVRMASELTELPEYPNRCVDDLEVVEAMVERMGAFARLLRDSIGRTAEWGDADTSDLYTEISRAVDKRLWFLEAHLQSN